MSLNGHLAKGMADWPFNIGSAGSRSIPAKEKFEVGEHLRFMNCLLVVSLKTLRRLITSMGHI